MGTTQKVVWRQMKEHGYVPRVAAKRDQRGSKNNSWNGGRTVNYHGYVLLKTTGHPRATSNGDYVFEHILVAEREIGRYLEAGEIVHHINGVKDDNRPCNLYITNPSEHSVMHNHGWAHTVTSNLDKFKEEC
ncbi:HNH endonuclease [Bacillus sp. 7894-2]|uniref:HNH endonuclease n=1 Tax=Bacillus sp. 7894-2 TaxID=2021695 RepID=UPI002570941E|nr:HNH endonuclease [Bacillus sp. 7894-2]